MRACRQRKFRTKARRGKLVSGAVVVEEKYLRPEGDPLVKELLQTIQEPDRSGVRDDDQAALSPRLVLIPDGEALLVYGELLATLPGLFRLGGQSC